MQLSQIQINQCKIIRREEFVHQLENNYYVNIFKDMVWDIVDEVKTSPQPLPDFSNLFLRKKL